MNTVTKMSTIFYVSVGDNSNDMGRVGVAKTLEAAKKIGRKQVRGMLPDGHGVYKVRDAEGREVLVGELSLCTAFAWVER